MSAALAIQKLTLAEAIQIERENDCRYEFFHGEITAMAGGRLNHYRISDRIGDFLKARFRPKGCEIYLENVKVEAIANAYYPYPDVMLSCHSFDTKKNNLFCRFPSLVVEVLSKGTTGVDKGRKLLAYRNMPSVKHYLLVSQYEVLVEVYSRIEDSRFFRHAVYQSLDEEIELEHLEFNLPVGKIYENIEFEEPTDED